jgi:hypothetical protein
MMKILVHQFTFFLLNTRHAKETEASYSRRSFQSQSRFSSNTSRPQGTDLFRTGFDDLCTWLIEMLHDGHIVSMMDVSAEYKTIIERRQEKQKPNMFRTSSIQARLKHKYGNTLHFEKNSNNEVSISDITFHLSLNRHY